MTTGSIKGINDILFYEGDIMAIKEWDKNIKQRFWISAIVVLSAAVALSLISL